jgi:hypothetical protein
MPIRMMRSVRTGKIAVYDEALIADGRWVEVKEEAAPAAPKPSANDDVAVKDEISVTLIKGTKDEGKRRKA